MTTIVKHAIRAGMTSLVLGLTACSTTGPAVVTSGNATATTTSAEIEAALPLVRTGAAVATGAVLDFAVKQSGTRTRLANEMYAAASAVYSLSGGAFPAPAQFQASILAFGGSQADANYAQFSTAIAGLYAAYYPKLATGDAKTAGDLLNALAGGIEDATKAYVTVPAGVASVTAAAGTLRVSTIWFGASHVLRESPFRAEFVPGSGRPFSNEVARTMAFPNGVWERGDDGEFEPTSF